MTIIAHRGLKVKVIGQGQVVIQANAVGPTSIEAGQFFSSCAMELTVGDVVKSLVVKRRHAHVHAFGAGMISCSDVYVATIGDAGDKTVRHLV